jgi:SulP family sulfate permease
VLMEGEKRTTERGVVVWLAGLNPSVLEVVRHAGLDQRLGQRLLFNAREAIERHGAQQAAGGGATQAAVS